MPLALPYSHLNLRYHPFGKRCLTERMVLAGADIDHLVGRLRRPTLFEISAHHDHSSLICQANLTYESLQLEGTRSIR